MNWLSRNKFFGALLSASRTLSSGSTLRKIKLYEQPLFIGLFLFLICSLFACHDKAALTQALIDKTVIQKVASHQRKKIKTCKEEAMREALIIADSVMIQLALSKVDTSGQGNRPIKPARPTLNLPVDTTPIKPLFEDTIIHMEDTAVLLEKPKLIGKGTLLKDMIKKDSRQ